MDEFGFINQYLDFPLSANSAVEVPIGDDAAVIDLNQLVLNASLEGLSTESAFSGRLVVASDTLLEGVHFPEKFAGS